MQSCPSDCLAAHMHSWPRAYMHDRTHIPTHTHSWITCSAQAGSHVCEHARACVHVHMCVMVSSLMCGCANGCMCACVHAHKLFARNCVCIPTRIWQHRGAPMLMDRRLCGCVCNVSEYVCRRLCSGDGRCAIAASCMWVCVHSQAGVHFTCISHRARLPACAHACMHICMYTCVVVCARERACECVCVCVC